MSRVRPPEEELSDPELKLWTRRHITRGTDFTRNRWAPDQFPTTAMCKMIRIDRTDFMRWLNGRGTMAAHVRRRFCQFINLWDAGLLDVVTLWKTNGQPRFIVRRETPKHMPIVLKVDWRKQALTFVPKKPPPANLPHMRPRSNVLDRLTSK